MVGIQPKSESSNVSYSEFLLEYVMKLKNVSSSDDDAGDGDGSPAGGGGGGLCGCFGGGGARGEKLRAEFLEEKKLLKRLLRTKFEGHGVSERSCVNGDGINMHARL